MGRPAKHSADDFIDAAIEIFADAGVRAVTLNAVAEAVGAANGSVYHRFPDRPSLLAAVWLRTSKRFEAAYREKLGEPTIDSAIDAAVWVVQWCGDNPAAAQVLESGARTFGPDAWPPAARDAISSDADLRRDARRNVQALAASTAAAPEEIAFAMLDLPIAVVRRSLHAGKAPGKRDAELVRSLATLILRRPVD